MRHPLLILCLLTGTCLAWGQPAPATSPSQQRRERLLNFFRGQTLDNYNRIGIRSPKWDADAQASLEALAKVLAWEYRPDGDEYDVIMDAARRLGDAGCSDSLVLFARARGYVYFNRRYEDVLPLHIESAKRIMTSGYEPYMKCMVNLRAAWLRARDRSDTRVSRREGRRLVEAAMDALPAALADPQIPVDVALDLMELAGTASLVVERDRAVIFDRAMPVLEQSPLAKPTILKTARAEFLSSYAHDARRDSAQTREQIDQLMAQRLAEAAEAAQQAWEADPSNARAADAMMQIQAARGADGQVVEQWFKRAVEADPDRLATYANRLRLLEPRSGGSPPKMIEFARSYTNHRDPDSGIPMLLIEAHLRAACFTDAGEQGEPQPAYFTHSPDVWKDISAVYEPYLQGHPNSLYHRSRYAQLAAWCGQWQTSDKQLRAMGEQFSLSWLRNRETWQQLRAQVAEHVR
jgi:hypothetical protein